MSKKPILTGAFATITAIISLFGMVAPTPVSADGNDSEITANGTTVIDPTTEGESSSMITRPDDNGVSKICDETMAECEQPAPDSTEPTTPEEHPVIAPEGEHLDAENNPAVPATSGNFFDDLLAKLNFPQNWPMYLSFGSILLAIIFFIVLNVIDRKRRKA